MSSSRERLALLLRPSRFYLTEVNIFIASQASTWDLPSLRLLSLWAHSLPGNCLDPNSLSFVSDCQLRGLTSLTLKESHIIRVRLRRVCSPAINLTMPMSPLLMLQLLHYLAAFSVVFLPGPVRKVSCCADWTGNQWFHKGEAAENVFRENKFSWLYSRAQWQVWHIAQKLYHSKIWLTRHNCHAATVVCPWKWLVEAGWEQWKHSAASRCSVIYLITSARSAPVKRSREAYPSHQTWQTVPPAPQNWLTDHNPPNLWGEDNRPTSLSAARTRLTSGGDFCREV